MIKKDTPLKKVLEIGKECERCGHCCNYGSGFLVKEDIKKIAVFLKLNEEELKESCLEEVEKFNTKLFRPHIIKNGKQYGTCIFFNSEDGCRIQEVKPLQCRIGNCGPYGEALSVWFMLNYFINKNDPESIRQFATYLKSRGKTLPGGTLNDIVPDKKKLKKILSYKIR